MMTDLGLDVAFHDEYKDIVPNERPEGYQLRSARTNAAGTPQGLTRP
jgi:hypothetical protein